MKKSLIILSIITVLTILVGYSLKMKSSTQNISETSITTTGDFQDQQGRSKLNGANPEDRPGLDLEAAAVILGVTVEELQVAIGNPETEPVTVRGVNLEGAAEALGVTTDKLREALGLIEPGTGGVNGGETRTPESTK